MVRILVILFGLIGCSQPELTWHKFDLDSKSSYDILKENEVYFSDFDLPNDTIRASLEVSGNGEVFNSIVLSDAIFEKDTLKIDLYTTNPAYHHEYTIFIVDDRYLIR